MSVFVNLHQQVEQQFRGPRRETEKPRPVGHLRLPRRTLTAWDALHQRAPHAQRRAGRHSSG